MNVNMSALKKLNLPKMPKFGGKVPTPKVPLLGRPRLSWLGTNGLLALSAALIWFAVYLVYIR